MTKEQIDDRVLQIIALLEYRKIIPNPSTCLDAIGIPRQSLTKVKNRKQHFTPKHIGMLSKEYNVNANCVFGIQENVFTNPNSTDVLDLFQ